MSAFPTVRLGDPDVASVVLGQSPPSSSYNDSGKGLPFFQGKADFGLVHPVPRIWCNAGERFADSGDVLLSVRAPVGDVNIATGPCAIGRGLAAIRAGTRIDPWFLYFTLLHQRPALEGRATGSTFASVNRATLLDLEVSLVEKAEQVKIGAFLRELIGKLDQESSILAVAEDLNRGATQALFTRGLRGEAQKETEVGLMPKSWTPTPIADLGAVKGGKRMPKGVALVQENTGRPYIRVSDFENHNVNEDGILFVPRGYEETIRRYRISTMDVYISIAGTIGLVGQVPKKLDDANLTENAAKIVFSRKDVLGRYVMYALASPACQEQIARATAKNAQPKLALTRIEQILVPLCPNMEDQLEIVATLDAIEQKIALHRRKRAVLEDLFKTLLHKLMIGEIRVTNLDLSALAPNGSEPAAA